MDVGDKKPRELPKQQSLGVDEDEKTIVVKKEPDKSMEQV